MITIKKLLSEIQAHSPIVPVEASKFDLKNEETFEEINKNLDTTLSVGFSTVGEAFTKVRKVLAMYRIELPQVDYNDNKSGTIKIPITQKDTSGENYFDVTGPAQEKSKDHMLFFSYKLSNGIYAVSAEIV
jgi:hypothetical protein